jgi:hypothetical protein
LIAVASVKTELMDTKGANQERAQPFALFIPYINLLAMYLTLKQPKCPTSIVLIRFSLTSSTQFASTSFLYYIKKEYFYSEI